MLTHARPWFLQVFGNYGEYLKAIESYNKRQWICARTQRDKLTLEEVWFVLDSPVCVRDSWSPCAHARCVAVVSHERGQDCGDR